MAACLFPSSVLASLAMLLAVSLFGAYRHLQSRGPGPAWIMAAWLMWLPLSALWAHSAGLSLYFATLLSSLPLAWLAGRNLQERGALEPLLYLLAPAILSMLIAWGLWQGPNTFTSKPQGPFNDPNLYAAMLNLLLLPLLARYLTNDLASSPRLWRTGTLGLIGAYGLVFSLVSSRGATLALLAGALLLLAQAKSQPQFRRKIALVATVWLTGYLLAGQINNSTAPVASRLGTLLAEGDAPRWQLLSSAWSMIQEHPWLGTGLGSFQYLYPPYRDPLERFTAAGWVHNDYLQLWVEAGILPLLLMMAVGLWCLHGVVREMRHPSPQALQRLGYLAAVLATLLHASVNFLVYFPAVSILLGLYLACLSKDTSPPAPRPLRLAALGLAAPFAYLMFGMLAVEVLLGHSRPIQAVLWKWGHVYMPSEAALWLSVASPFDSRPKMVVADELSSLWQASGRSTPQMHSLALSALQESQRLLPCDPVASSQTLMLLSQSPALGDQQPQARAQFEQFLSCNPRSGITYYYAGLITERENPDLAIRLWRRGLTAGMHKGEQLMLAAVLLSREIPEKRQAFELIAAKLAEVWMALLSNRHTGVDRTFGNEMEGKLRLLGGERYEALLRDSPLFDK